MSFELPQLPYAYDALTPHIDAQTMEIHHSKHHAGYVMKLNAAVEGTEWESKSVEELITNLDSLPDNIRTAVRNNGGGHYNHSFFWKHMAPANQGGGEAPSGHLAADIAEAFGSYDEFKKQFNDTATSRFGSGWAWLIRTSDGNLQITSTPNQDNPKMDDSSVEILLGVDVWEHAYYLNYQNRRADYLEAWWSVVSWAE